MNLSTTRDTRRDTRKDGSPTATVVALPRAAPRRFKREDDSARGQILLFTGIRYERIAEPEDEAAAPQRKLS